MLRRVRRRDTTSFTDKFTVFSGGRTPFGTFEHHTPAKTPTRSILKHGTPSGSNSSVSHSISWASEVGYIPVPAVGFYAPISRRTPPAPFVRLAKRQIIYQTARPVYPLRPPLPLQPIYSEPTSNSLTADTQASSLLTEETRSYASHYLSGVTPGPSLAPTGTPVADQSEISLSESSTSIDDSSLPQIELVVPSYSADLPTMPAEDERYLSQEIVGPVDTSTAGAYPDGEVDANMMTRASAPAVVPYTAATSARPRPTMLQLRADAPVFCPSSRLASSLA